MLPRYPILSAALAATLGCVTGDEPMTEDPTTQDTIPERPAIERVISSWPESSRKAATAMMEKYGRPDGITPSRLIWRNNGPWMETIVYKDEVPHHWPMKHTDVLEQVVRYKVPPRMFSDLARFDGSVIVERTKGTLAARCDKEEANFLALNLAHDIITGNKNVEEAREHYEQAIRRMMEGDLDPHLKGLRFQIARRDTGDPDRAAIQPRETP